MVTFAHFSAIDSSFEKYGTITWKISVIKIIDAKIFEFEELSILFLYETKTERI